MTDEELRYELEHHQDYERYQRWKAKHPNVFQKFREYTMKLLEKKRRFGMWLVANRIRWDYTFHYDEDFKICNNFTALITRELMLEIPELKHYCSIKKMGVRYERVLDRLHSSGVANRTSDCVSTVYVGRSEQQGNTEIRSECDTDSDDLFG